MAAGGERRGQVNGPGRALPVAGLPARGQGRAGPGQSGPGGSRRESERWAERRGRPCERARLRRAEAGAACPAQTPPPAFLRPPAPSSFPPSATLPGTRGDAVGPEARTARGLPPPAVRTAAPFVCPAEG